MFFSSTFRGNVFDNLGLWGILFIIFVLALIYISIWSTIAELFAIKDHKEKIGFTEAFKRSMPYINPFFFTCLLVFLAVFGGFILLIIPGILFMLWFSQLTYVVINENLSGSKALNRSKQYVKGRIGEIFVKYLYMLAIIIAASIQALL